MGKKLVEKAEELLTSIAPGTKLYGYCNGYFGSDAWREKVIVASGIEQGGVWVVARELAYPESYLVFGSGIPLDLPVQWGDEALDIN